MRAALVVSTLLLLAPAASRADVASDVVAPYLRIQIALANDSLSPVKADAALIAAGAARLGDTGKALKDAATALGAAATLEDARTAFGPLSDALVKYAESAGTSLGSDLQVAYCPMVKQSWIQKGKAILNPYGGKQMQTCGQIVKAVK